MQRLRRLLLPTRVRMSGELLRCAKRFVVLVGVHDELPSLQQRLLIATQTAVGLGRLYEGQTWGASRDGLILGTVAPRMCRSAIIG
jgi:hypothetical protein